MGSCLTRPNLNLQSVRHHNLLKQRMLCCCIKSFTITVPVIQYKPCHWHRQFCAGCRFWLNSTHRSRLDSTYNLIQLPTWLDSQLDSNINLVWLPTLFDLWLDFNSNLSRLSTWFDSLFLTWFDWAFLIQFNSFDSPLLIQFDSRLMRLFSILVTKFDY